jgi:hypothetical protein
MPRPKGLPKTGGRKQGSLNRRTLALQEALLDDACSVPGHISKLLSDDDIPPMVKMDFIIRLMPYLYPQQKAVDPEGYITIDQALELQSALMYCFKSAVSLHASSLEQANAIIRDFHLEADRYRQNGT